MTTIAIDVPDHFSEHLGQTPEDRQRFILKALAIEVYRQGRLGRYDLASMLGMGVIDFDSFLLERGVPNGCTIEELKSGYRIGKKFLVPSE